MPCLCSTDRFLFELALMARKCVLIALAATVTDPVLATLLSLMVSLPLWALTVMWKPFAQQMHARTLQTVVMSQQVSLGPGPKSAFYVTA